MEKKNIGNSERKKKKGKGKKEQEMRK